MEKKRSCLEELIVKRIPSLQDELKMQNAKVSIGFFSISHIVTMFSTGAIYLESNCVLSARTECPKYVTAGNATTHVFIIINGEL